MERGKKKEEKDVKMINNNDNRSGRCLTTRELRARSGKECGSSSRKRSDCCMISNSSHAISCLSFHFLCLHFLDHSYIQQHTRSRASRDTHLRFGAGILIRLMFQKVFVLNLLTNRPPRVVSGHHVDAIEEVVFELLHRVGAGKTARDSRDHDVRFTCRTRSRSRHGARGTMQMMMMKRAATAAVKSPERLQSLNRLIAERSESGKAL